MTCVFTFVQRTCCRKFDFDSNDKWKEYLNALTFPPGRKDLVLKYQAKWYKREIEPEFDISEVVPTSAPTVEKAAHDPNCTHSCCHNDTAPKATPSSSSAPSPPPPSFAPQTRPSFLDIALLAGHMYLFACCLMAIQPFNPILAIKGMAQCNKISLPVHLARLYRKVGNPSTTGIVRWFKSVSRTTESFHIFLISMASSNPSAWPGVLAVAILTAFHISAALNLIFGKSALWTKSGAGKVHRYLAVHQQEALQAIAVLEIGTFFAVALSSLRKGPMGLFSVFAFAAQLRMRFWSPESRVYHVNGWKRLGDTAEPVLSKVAFARTLVERGQKFFEAGRPQKEE
jgi:hypothetical protein